MAESILKQDGTEISKQNIYGFSGQSLSFADRYILVNQGHEQLLVENTFSPKINVNKKIDSDEDSSSWFTPQVITKAMWPVCILGVLAYQFYSKTPAAPKKALELPSKKEPTKDDLNKKFAALSKELGAGKSEELKEKMGAHRMF